MIPATDDTAGTSAWVRDQLPPGGLFQDQDWRVAPAPFPISPELHEELTSLGRVLLQFYRAIQLLHRNSLAGKAPEWVASLYDQGKPDRLLEWQRDPALRQELPRIIRPDLLLTDEGFMITELDSVPGGIGLTGWLNQTYSQLPSATAHPIVGGARGMIEGFDGIFGAAKRIHLVVSEESGSYRPEMEWLARHLDRPDRPVMVRDVHFEDWRDGDAAYRFFELFDLGNIPSAASMMTARIEGRIQVTPPFKPMFEEKLSLSLLWNRNLRTFWRQHLGDSFLKRLQRHVPYSWVLDPTPLPPHAAIPRLELAGWTELKQMSQKERDLILKVSGYSEDAWGARGVYLGSDLSQPEWSAAVDSAIAGFPRSPYVLQQYHKPGVIDFAYHDFAAGRTVAMPSRVRLCPYYFVKGEGDQARAELGGVLATACPSDKKIIHGMKDAVLAPCAVVPKEAP